MYPFEVSRSDSWHTEVWRAEQPFDRGKLVWIGSFSAVHKSMMVASAEKCNYTITVSYVISDYRGGFGHILRSGFTKTPAEAIVRLLQLASTLRPVGLVQVRKRFPRRSLDAD